jgi:hypothetical protein
MKKAILLLLLFAGSYTVMAQDNSDSTTTTKEKVGKDKVKTHKGKTKHKQKQNNAFNAETPMDNTEAVITDSLSSGKVGTFALMVPATDYVMTIPYTGLPVLQTQVPSLVVETFKNKYVNILYDIASFRDLSGQEAYRVRIYEKGQYRVEYLDEFGNPVADPTIKIPDPIIVK